MEHLVTIDLEDRLADAEVVMGILHVIVGTEGKAYPAPCRECLRETGASDAEGLMSDVMIEDALSLLRTGHQAMCPRGHGIVDVVADKIQGVEHIPRLCVVDLKMQMGTGTMACIAT